MAQLKGCDLASADLKGADLRKAKGISRDQIYGAKNFQLALYSEDLLDPLKLGFKIGLPKNTNAPYPLWLPPNP